MKTGLTRFLQGLVILLGIAALAFLLWEPHLEGRNTHATVFEIYFKDPFLAYAYFASLTFFLGLYQAFKVLGLAGQNKLYTPEAVSGLRTIRYCAIALIGFVALGEVFILSNTSDDRAGGVAMGVLISFGAILVAVAAAKFERRLRGGLSQIQEMV